ncbi:helix-turn-helix transcriptional regulator [Niveispirillum sp.]|uniref:ArsR/SmtB family transcription factor n=1 Tax=Niveispirillum sp. TaxID=1917217 RepID=UPI001B5F8349|nr:metalloregulator ArsR/SmtB family transcription factor [Niveispirillum sp.]MBP7336192.1 helix-turn-helix transcriptional regulator [Niveispirillum sp.]
MDAMPLPVKTVAAAALLKAMGNERRLSILLHLSQGEKSVGELESLVGLSQSALSQHLAVLRQERMVRTRRQAQTIFYRLDGDTVGAILSLLRRLYPA